jgi:deoxycytidylate deaminase
MSLDNFYKLRRNFIILGLTGKMRSGSDLIVDLLTQKKLTKDQSKFLNDFSETYKGVSYSESRKIRRITDFYNYPDNWIKFEVIEYRNVVLLFLLNHCYDSCPDKFADNIANWIIELGSYKKFEYPRFGSEKGVAFGSKIFIETEFKNEFKKSIQHLKIDFNKENLIENLNKDEDFFFSKDFQRFTEIIFAKLDSFSPYLRYRLIHITTYLLRRFGTLDMDKIKSDGEEDGLEYIYTIADVINRLIKIHRNAKPKNKKFAHVIIDRLKNSYELMYFKEKYSGFYMIGTNADEKLRNQRIEDKFLSFKDIIDPAENERYTRNLDDVEFKVEGFKKGVFERFDVENCLQKVDYHTYLTSTSILEEIKKEYINAGEKINNKELERTNKFYIYQPFIIQLLKLIASILQPGIVQPNYVERIMQIAHLAKLNSGCISRQVGAVVTDSHFSVKGIGWNEVPVGQIPCSLRDLRDLVVDKNDGFSRLEIGETEHLYDDGESFKNKIVRDFEENSDELIENLKGRSCSFCFKTFHNAYEGKENQVHTRSLHAEENAMLQVTKYGGQGLESGNLFTTASPCELCSKKAFQLGIKNIFYIDLYPGISRDHILEGGRNSKSNPSLYQYQGAIGSGYQKLYKPFMSAKDETFLRTKIKPTKKQD